MMQKIKMKRTDWTYLTLTEEEFEKAFIGESELRFRDKMYDVAEIKTSGNILHIKALYDEEEETIFSELNKFFGKNGEKNKSALRHLLKFDIPYISSSGINLHCFYHSGMEHAFDTILLVIPGYYNRTYNPPELI